MIQTQIQVKENQINWLRSKAKDKGKSVSQLIREGIDLYRFKEEHLPAQKKKNALAAVGLFSSGKSDISVQHDKYIGKDYIKDKL